MGVKSGEALVTALKGGKPEKQILVPIVVATSKNIDQILPTIKQTVFANELQLTGRRRRAPASRSTDDGPGDPAAGGARDLDKSFAQTRALVGARSQLCGRASRMRCSARTARASRRCRGSSSGHVRRDGGEIIYRGQPLDVRSPREALDAGIAMVMQETSLAPDLSVLENIFLPELGRPGRLSLPARCAARRERSSTDLGQERGAAARFRGAATFPRRSASWSRSPRRWRSMPTLIIFDEPTASLSPERSRTPVRRDRQTRAPRNAPSSSSRTGSRKSLRSPKRSRSCARAAPLRPRGRPRASTRPSSFG